MVVAGGNHTLAVKTNKSLWSWGLNNYGQLGLGNKINRTTPCQVGTALDWSIVAGGAAFSVAKKTNGTLWAWGDNNYGQLGCGWILLPDSDVITTVISSTLISILWIDNYNETNFRVEQRRLNKIGWLISSNGLGGNAGALPADTTSYSASVGPYTYQFRVWAFSSFTTPTQIGNDSDWSTIKSGVSHTLAIKNYGTLWSWGDNRWGELGIGIGQDNRRVTPTMIGK
jgi:alpha-tubulin suppressor-like RCC1 family protein